MQTTILTASDVRSIVHRVGLDALMDETISRLTETFARFDPEEIVVPARDGFQYDFPDTGLIEWMPCMRTGESAYIKVVGYHPNNGVRHGLPTILSTLSMYGVRDGHLRGLMDATFVTALRTGAASAVASRILAIPESTRLGIIGCGAQAVTQLHALSRILPIADLYIFDADAEAMASFPGRIACLGLDGLRVHLAQTEEFLGEVDVLCTATSVGIGQGPVFEGRNLRPHLHVNAVGSDFPGKIEVPLELLRESFVCPDFAEQALKEGECQQLCGSEIGPSVHVLVKNSSRYMRERAGFTVFDSTGWAVEDMACMNMFMEYASAFGLGNHCELESVSTDCLNPYQFLLDPSGDVVPQERRSAFRRVV